MRNLLLHLQITSQDVSTNHLKRARVHPSLIIGFFIHTNETASAHVIQFEAPRNLHLLLYWT